MGAVAVRCDADQPFADATEILAFARTVLRHEAEALLRLCDRLSVEGFARAVQLILRCQGKLIICGMGKAGLIGRKWAATFSSTGTPSLFLHPGDAVHGDLGCVQTGDLAVVLSLSGETEEIVRLIPCLLRMAVPILAVTSHAASTLGRASEVVLELGPVAEACPLGLAPTTSTTLMLALGDALALVVSRQRGFSQRDFLRYHPGGSLGRKLTYVEEVMRPLAECRVASDAATVREALLAYDRPGRRTGAIMLVDESGRLTGIFTDSDLARLIVSAQDAALDRPICHVMTRTPKVIAAGSPLQLALDLLQEHKISELPVVDRDDRPIGLIDITDVVGWPQMPAALRLHRPVDQPS